MGFESQSDTFNKCVYWDSRARKRGVIKIPKILINNEGFSMPVSKTVIRIPNCSTVLLLNGQFKRENWVEPFKIRTKYFRSNLQIITMSTRYLIYSNCQICYLI